jgi:hypothetical protein
MKKFKRTKTTPRLDPFERIREELRIGLRHCVCYEKDTVTVLALIDDLYLGTGLARTDEPDGERVVTGTYKDVFYFISHQWGVDGNRSTYLALMADISPLLNKPHGKQRIDRLMESFKTAKNNDEVWGTYTEFTMEIYHLHYGDESDGRDDYVTTC